MSSSNNISSDPPQKHHKSPREILDDFNSAVNTTKSVITHAVIHRVPKEIRRLNESAYTPCLVSIGPLHHPCEAEQHNLKLSIKDIKMYYVDSLLDRASKWVRKSKEDLLEECIVEMKGLKEDAKIYYAEKVEVLDEEMLVIDGCFILELLYRNCHPKVPYDPIFNNRLTYVTVQRDLLLVENQLPFFILERLFSLTVNEIRNRSPADSLSQYVLLYFKDMMCIGRKRDAKNRCSPGDCILSVFPCSKMNREGSATPERKAKEVQYHHILHILHDHYVMEDPAKEEGKDKSGDPAKEEGKDKSGFMPCASELVYAGVKFKACNGEPLLRAKFTEIQRPFGWFHRARFEIPTLDIYDSTELILRNLIAFEQCQCDPRVSSHFTSYALLMDRLVNDEKDIKVLEKARVICNNLGSAEQAYKFFNELCKEVVPGRTFHYAKTCTHAVKYSNRCWPEAIANARRKYFATPWSSIAFCVASILSIITIIQFIRSFLR